MLTKLAMKIFNPTYDQETVTFCTKPISPCYFLATQIKIYF